MAKIYVSGGFYGKYKGTITRLLGKQHVLLDPELDASAMARLPCRYIERDLEDIAASDAMLVVQTDYPYVYGMAAEVGFVAGLAHAQQKVGDAGRGGVPGVKIPDVIYVCLTKRVDGFLSGLARAVFTEIEAACEFINARYV